MKTLGKGEIALPVSTRLENFLTFSSNLKLSGAKSFSLEGSKICRLGKGLGQFTDTNSRACYADFRKFIV